jgi:ABC-type transport system substrate-binding protein
MNTLISRFSPKSALNLARRKFRVGVALVVGASLAIASPAVVATSASAAPSGQLIIANGEPITAAYYDPHSAFGLVDAQLGSLVFDTLLVWIRKAMFLQALLHPSIVYQKLYLI